MGILQTMKSRASKLGPQLAPGAAVLALATDAMAGESIGSAGTGPFGMITEWLQMLVDFMDGPFGLAAVIISLLIAYCTWMFAPKEGIVGPTLRIAVGGIVVLNVGAWIASLRSGTST
ncbi:hypothetical protein [Eleftheria terrae]|uniref:hypothetical protein n=1 Tax=Eleftheria terrae TaxID=1597781 RepID=UPI00263B240A|nr:hypothetical protein [Eleftheria terrae]WKB50505.1 hypothetical protein N7L95_00215 [Eleftheria terrae]